MPAKNGFIFDQQSDMDFLRSVHLLRLATIHHLAALASGPSGQGRSYTRTARRTAKLSQHGYLEPIKKPPRKVFYTLGKEGMAALVQLGYAPEEILHRQPHEKDLKDLFFNHFLHIKDTQVKLLLQTRGTPLRIAEWREDHGLYSHVTIQEEKNGKKANVRLPIRPDAFFVIQDTTRPEGEDSMAFVLEADQSQERHEVLRNKVKGYVNYYEQDLAFDQWGYELFRVLIVTKTPERATNLRTSLQPLIPDKLRAHYLFTDLEALTLDMLIS
jgi:Replication-relaxation